MNKNVFFKSPLPLVIIALVIIIYFAKSMGDLSQENQRLTNNQAVLLDSLQTYKVADSLNAAKINTLELSLSDYKKYRAEDAALIKKLKAGKLAGTTSVSTETNTSIKTLVKDSIVYKDRAVPVDTLKQIKYESQWTSINGYLDNDTISLKIKNRVELFIVETLTKKKFLFFKLPVKIFGYKSKQVDAIARDPNTEVTNLERIQIYD